jgi:riboflavin kinase/FMN adenylyltransferase
LPSAIVTPGNHDGVHLGHRALVARASALAKPRGLSTTALFFYPNAAAVLAPERAPALLTSPERRAELLREAGADRVEVQGFDREFAALSPPAFVRQVLVERLGAKHVVVGEDFRFGRQRAGDVRLLAQLGEELHFEVDVLPKVEHAGRVVSSTRIRQALSAGQVEDACAMLGRLHEIDGVVVRGDARGRTIGFPTANLRTEGVLLPGDGVYAVLMRRVDQPEAPRLLGVANLGTRPTFQAGRSTEVHVLDFDGDLYDARVRLGFVAKLRDEVKFDGVTALIAQLERDVVAGRERLTQISESEARWI